MYDYGSGLERPIYFGQKVVTKRADNDSTNHFNPSPSNVALMAEIIFFAQLKQTVFVTKCSLNFNFNLN